ncbi:LutC/YkgG family protein [Corynebacterium macginleyi]|uniref:LUD domain-containing protein n=1 Tax=Corynebacterium macginleyi TaxID=38290 RepID=A0ABS1Y6M0_9CORY|nr:LUD domain-containing protein [Corynebacterium macginleyi]MBK4146948.1 lactate utilization protein C [Corynebacterium macginleyi]MBK4150899.1 lactate utilization protein C [Corynebacterium macginleyi]MBK4159393.1 lactate utilization protein C [Corynebacterium macginleyi]MBK4168402.1 lactate utilization protein C [Corynebacterium macginleyi]MBM0244017.1 LUD domain-containing protein [Corynebacterium macginleyi]
MTAKQEILNRIRSAQKQAGLPDHVDIPRDYQRKGTLNDDELREMLVDRLEDYKAEVHITEESDLKKTLETIVKDRNCTDIRYAPGMNAELFIGLPARPDDEAADPRELDDADAVVTESFVSSAQTGTIVLQSNSHCGRRALTLVPDRHICIVRRDQIVYGVPEVISRIDPYKPATWISGPSATSDIELSRVEGVHGPRDLIVIIVK